MEIASSQPRSATYLTRGYLICVTATVFWSSTGVLIRYLTENYGLPALVLAFWRDLGVSLALALVFWLFNPSRLHIERRDWRFLAAYGLVVSLFNALWTISVVLNGAAVSTVLAYSSTAFTALLGWWLLGERLGWIKILAVTLSMLGCVLVSGAADLQAWQSNPLGILTGLLSGLAFATYSLMGRTASQRGINPWTTLLYAFAFAALFLLSYNFMAGWLPVGTASTRLMWLGNEWMGWAILLFLAIGPTIGGFGLYTVSLTFLPASTANLIATLEPVMTAVLAYLVLGEVLTAPQLRGSALIIAGVVLLRFGEGRISSRPDVS